ncbi:heparan-alpha-glucosaminide N-acetyltransferase domain-containing protein [Candidatus Altiarchaeota archaeon]
MNSQKRICSVDALRGLAIILMLTQHAVLFLGGKEEMLARAFVFLVSRLSAPLFFLLVGACLVLSAQRRSEGGASESMILKHFLGRSIYIIILGVILNVFKFDYAWELNVLHTIAFSILLAAPFVIIREWWLVLLPILVVLKSSLKVFSFDGISLWGWETFWSLPFYTGEYRLLPWSALFLLGVIMGKMIVQKRSHQLFLSFGVLLQVAALGVMWLDGDFQFWPGTTSFALYSAGAGFVAYAIFQWLYAKDSVHPQLFRPLEVFGRHALFIYLIHHVILYTLLRLVGLANSFSLFSTAIIFILFNFLLYKILGNQDLCLSKVRDTLSSGR